MANNYPKVFKIGKFIYLCRYNKAFWFRLWGGWGIAGKSVKTYGLMFSERYNHVFKIVLFGWLFRLLKPHKDFLP